MQEWWRSAVIYQVYPRPYQNSRGNGVGDLAGITQSSGHISDLGVDCLWLSPIFASPKKDMGYDVSNCIAVDPQRVQYYLRNFLASQPDFEFSQSLCD